MPTVTTKSAIDVNPGARARKRTHGEAQVSPSLFEPGKRSIETARGMRALFMSQVQLDFLGPVLVFLRAIRDATSGH
jgi:hypothetical protein